jgi:hypothetical protein
VTDADTAAAWIELHAANDALGWFVGRPAFEPHRLVPWSQYAFDPFEKQKLGKRSREWTAVGNTEAECIREMARCLREIGERQVPR